MSREVELVVRLKDEVSRFADTVVDSLKEMATVQTDLAKGAGKTSNLLGQLGKDFKDLNAEANRLTSLGKIVDALDRSAVAVKNLETNVKSSAQEFARLARESQTASVIADKLRGSLEAEQNALREANAARRDASKELTAATRAVSQAERTQDRYNKTLDQTARSTKGVGVEAGAPVSSARASAGVFIGAQVEATRSTQAALSKEVKTFQQEVERSTQAVAALKPEVQAAARFQADLAAQTDKASNSLAKGRDNLDRARSAYTGISASADQAADAMGRTNVTQDQVAKSAARAAAELARTKAQIDALSKATAQRGSTSDVSRSTEDTSARRAAIERLRELRKELGAAQADAQRLNREFKTTAEPTEALGRAAGQSQVRVRELKTEVADLTTRLRSSQGGFLQWSQSVTQLQNSTTGAITAARTLGDVSRRASDSVRPMGQAARDAGNALNSAGGGANSLRNALSGVYGESRKALSLMQRMRGEVLSLAAAYFGLNAAINNIGGVIRAFQTLEAAQNRLGSVFNQDTGRIRQELEWLERQAARLGIEFGVLASQYGKFSIAAKEANYSSEATRKIFMSVAEAGRVNKLSVDQLEGIFLALEQMISKGKVSSEELRRQLGDRLPGAFNIFANALGVSTEKLDDMMRKGEVLSTQSNLLKFAEQLDKRFGSQLASSLQSTTTEIGRWSNNIYQAQLLVARGGFIDAFTSALRSMNEYFQSREGRDFFLSLGSALGTFVTALAKVTPYIDDISTGFQIFAAIKIAGVLSGIISGMRTAATTAGSFAQQMNRIGPPTMQFVQNQTALTRVVALGIGRLDAFRASAVGATGSIRLLSGTLGAMRPVVIGLTGLFRGLWAAVGGIPGIILTGVTLAIGQWISRIDEATSALDEHQRQMQAVKSAYDDAKGKVENWSKAVNNLTASQTEDNLGKLLEEYNKKFTELTSIAGRARQVLGLMFNAADADARRAAFGEEEVERLRRLVELLDEAGKTRDLTKLRKELDAIAQSTAKPALKGLAVELQNALDRADEGGNTLTALSEAIDLTSARLRLLKGEATDADKALLGLTDAGKGTSDQTATLGENSKKLTETFVDMGSKIASVADELKRLETINGLDKQYKDAVKLASTMSEVMGLTNRYNEALNGVIDQSFSSNSSLVDKIVGAESNGRVDAKNSESTATGLGQFIESTWLRMFKQYFPDRADGLSDAMILELRKNATVSREMVALYIQENAKILKQAGIALTDANLYLAHFLGPGGATKLLSAGASTPVSDVLGADQIAANKSVLEGKTQAEVVAWAQKKVGVSQEEFAIQKELADQDQKRTEKAQEYNTELENRLSLQENENSNAGKLTQEAFIQKRLAEEQKKAKAAEVTLTDEQIARIKATAAAEWEVANAKRDSTASTKEANTALQQAVALNQQRNALQQQFNAAIKAGDLTAAGSLQLQLDSTNAKLQEAIDKARAMWEAIGGEDAAVALTKLDTLKIKADTATNGLAFLGLATQQVGQLAGSFADGLAGVFDRMAQAIANGENAVKALGTAFLEFAADFLRQIAMMIMKQIILNALQSFGIPGIGVGHTGGVVGSAGIGIGNGRKPVAPGLFATAHAYHTGGIGGLAPDEVPAVLRRGEEVLTEEDSRHRNNGGLNDASGAAGSGPSSLRAIVVLDDETAQQMMNSATGEKAFVMHARKNKGVLKSLLG